MSLMMEAASTAETPVTRCKKKPTVYYIVLLLFLDVDVEAGNLT